MPPRPKFAKEEIVDAAYRIMETKGMDAVVAREVGKELGATVAPIFTYFNSMDELKEAVYEKALHICSDYLRDCTDYDPAFKEFGLRWIRFAKEHPHAYAAIFLSKGHASGKDADGLLNKDCMEIVRPFEQEIVHTFSIAQEVAELLLKDMCIYAQGIASMLVSGQTDYREDQISVRLSRMCVSCVAGCHIKEGTLDEERIRVMLSQMERKPHRKET